MAVVINGTTGIDTGTGSLIAADSTTPTYLDLYEDTDNGSKYVRLIAPTSVASNRTITLPDGTGTVAVNNVNGVLVSSSAITLTNQTAPEFTGIPSWAKRITVMFSGVSTNGTNTYQIQIGAGSMTTSGYAAINVSTAGTAIGTTAYTSGFVIVLPSAATNVNSGAVRITKLTGNTWVVEGVVASTDTNRSNICAGSITLGGTLDRLRIIASATGSPSDTFDAGTVNIMWE